MTGRTTLWRVIGVFLAVTICAGSMAPLAWADDTEEPSKLLVVWTSADREVALNMVFMYTFNAAKRGWWKEIRLLVWGPSAKLLAGDTQLQEYVKQMKEEGVEILACKACADNYGVGEKLESIGAKVFYTGVALTEMLKSDWVTVTF